MVHGPWRGTAPLPHASCLVLARGKPPASWRSGGQLFGVTRGVVATSKAGSQAGAAYIGHSSGRARPLAASGAAAAAAGGRRRVVRACGCGCAREVVLLPLPAAVLSLLFCFCFFGALCALCLRCRLHAACTFKPGPHCRLSLSLSLSLCLCGYIHTRHRHYDIPTPLHSAPQYKQIIQIYNIQDERPAQAPAAVLGLHIHIHTIFSGRAGGVTLRAEGCLEGWLMPHCRDLDDEGIPKHLPLLLRVMQRRRYQRKRHR
jgi:hypothetical protein